ncbi:phage tail tape measure protein [Streptomyces mirabilis]|uniref:phage tail tape measure protein n=1 Tax=Streptomyces mirabilis TaxID=68239 RepID=UPI0036ABD1DA
MAEVADLFVLLRAETAPFTRGMSEAAAKGESFTAKMGGVGGMMTKLGKATALVGVGVAAVSVKMAADFQTATVQLVTSAGETNDKLQMVRKGLLDMAGQVGVKATDLAKAMYYVEAAGYHAGGGLTVLKAAAQGAAAEGADTTTVAKALTDVLKDYHLKASAAGDITSKMITAVAHGKVNLQDFSASFANIIPAASAAGISFNDAAAALATMTNHGFTAQRASQNLAQALRSLLNPTKPMKKAFSEFGVTTQEVSKKLHGPNGLTDAMEFLSQAATKAGKEGTPEFASALKRLMGTAPGANAALTTVGANFKDTNDTIKAMAGSTVDAHGKVKGFAEVQTTLNQRVKQLKAGFDSLLIQLGTKLIPIVTAAIGFFTQHKAATEALAVAIGVVLTGSVLKFIGGALKPFVSGIGGIGKAVGKIPWDKIGSGASSAFETLRLKGMYAWDGVKSGAGKAATAVADFGKSVGKATATAGKAAWAGMVSGAKAVGSAMKTASLAALEFGKSTIKAAIAGARAAATWVAEKVALIASTIAEKAAAVAQWALDAAMDANPITLIVLALIALVGAIVYAYTHFTWFRNGVKAAWSAIVDAAKTAWDWLKKAFASIVEGLVWAYHGMVNTGKSVFNWVKALPGRILGFLAGLGAQLALQAIKAWSSFKSSVVSKAGEAITWVKGIPGRVKGALGDLGGLLLSAGKSLIDGFISGVKSAFGAVQSTLSHLTNMLPSWKGPPARDRVLLHGAGQMIIGGLVDGMNSRFGDVQATAVGVAQATVDSVSKTLGIASPSKVFRSLGIYVNEGLVDGLTASTARVKAATRRIETLLIQTYNKVADLKGTKGVSNKWVRAHEATIKHLEAYAAREDKVLRGLAAKRDSVAKRIKDAQKALAAVQKQWGAEVKTVAQGIMQGFSVITAAPQQGFSLTAQDVVNKMRDQMARATQFAADLHAAQKKGLSSDLVAQIAAAGVDQGSETAAALAAASKGQIQQIDSLQKATQGAANGVGAAVADSMYGAGLKSAQGLVKGLQSQEKAIERQMMKIAKSMQKAIKHALGIKSPSAVFAEIGTWIPKGLAKGIEGSVHHATQAVHRMAGSVSAAASFAGAGLAMSGGGGGTVINHFEIHIEPKGHVLSTNRELRDLVQQEFARLGMRNSQTWAPYKR